MSRYDPSDIDPVKVALGKQLKAELESCPACGALPADQVNHVDYASIRKRTREMFLAPSGLGEYAADWEDKPHRVLYDALNIIRSLTSGN